jgi:subtilisin family serine protease
VFALLLGLTAMTLTVLSLAAPPRPTAASVSKIAPWLLSHVSSGQQTEFLVVLADQASLRGAQSLTTKAEKGRFVREALWNKAQMTQAPLLQWLRARGIEHRAYYIVNMIWVKADLSVAQMLAARPDVARIEGNPEIHNALPQPLPPSKSPAAPEQAETVEPGISYTHAPDVWAMGYTGQGIVIGGGDTGYFWTHSALINKYRGWNGVTANHDYNWHDSIHNAGGGNSCGSDSTQPCDDMGHGTHTMGTAVGDDGLGNQIGMAPGAKWIGCRNMAANNGTPARYIECFEFFLAPYPVNGTPAQGDPSKAPDITTNSWSCTPGEGCSVNDLQAAIEAQRAAGIMTIVAAGNAGSGCATVNTQPATLDAAYSIGALNTGTDTIAGFSSRGPVTLDGSNRLKPDLCAPGTNTRSCVRTGPTSYDFMSGTSMATPHVAGAVALLWSAQPSLRNDIDRTEAVLNDTAVHLSSVSCSSPQTSPNYVFGYGRLDIKRAVDAALMRVIDVAQSNSTDVIVTFYAVTGRTYRLERTDSLSPADWQSIPGVSDFAAGATGSATMTDPGAISQGSAFYRVRLLP